MFVAESVQERYASSRRHLRSIGAAALRGETNLHGLTDYAQARADFISSIREMIVTDPELRMHLDIDDKRTYRVIDGQARDIDGQTMTSLIQRGYAITKERAADDHRYKGQEIRDQGDLITSEIADDLAKGQAYVTISMSPRKDISNYPEVYKREFGYDRNLIYLQGYAKTGRVEAFSYSMHIEDEDSLKEVLREFNINIPAGEDYNTWIHHGAELTAEPAEVQALLLSIRKKYYDRIGLSGKRLSVTDFVTSHENILDTYFSNYYPEIGKALVIKRNQLALNGLAQALLRTDLRKMDPSLRSRLVAVAGARFFDEDSGDAMESILRYAVVEDLRPYLLRKFEGNRHIQNTATIIPRSFRGEMPIEYLHSRLAVGVSRGIVAERMYGGCSGGVNLNRDESGMYQDVSLMTAGELLIGEKQMAYGGLGGKDDLGNRVFYCSNGHRNTRPYNDTIEECQHRGCKAQVKCGPKKSKTRKRI